MFYAVIVVFLFIIIIISIVIVMTFKGDRGVSAVVCAIRMQYSYN